MGWSIEWTIRALRDLKGLDHQIARRVSEKLEQSTTDPGRFFSKMAHQEEWKLRVGDLRVLAYLHQDRKSIEIRRVDHRSRVYDR